MAIEIINDHDESTVNDFKKFTGVIPYNVIAINPTMRELHELGLGYIKKEPEYVREFENGGVTNKSTTIDIWLKSLQDAAHPEVDFTTKLSFFISHEPFVGNNTGKKQYVNLYGKTCWVNDPSELSTQQYYLDKDSRPAHKGEEDLYKFMFSWLNMTFDPDRNLLNPCCLDVQKIISGDYSELQAIVPAAKPYVVKCLTGVKKVDGDDGNIKYYTTIYGKYFMKHNQRSVDSLKKYIAKSEYNEFGKNGEVYYTFEVKEFDPSSIPTADPDPTANTISVGGRSSDVF